MIRVFAVPRSMAISCVNQLNNPIFISYRVENVNTKINSFINQVSIKPDNFIQRSNVEFTEYRTPNNDVWPEYNRTASLDDMRAKVTSQYDADDLYHRQDMMEHQMAKMNRESWQQRYAPLRRTANSSVGPM